MPKHDDGLFLVEILLDKIKFVKSPCFSDKEFKTCAVITCPGIEPLEFCDDDPTVTAPKSGGPFTKNFNTGKSCLFFMKEADINKAMSSFVLNVSVYKTLPCGCLPTKVVMGEAKIDMTKEFVMTRKKFLEDPTTVNYQALKDTFRLTGTDGQEAGEIEMFLRISCFGNMITTKFQGSGPPNIGGTSASASVVDRSCKPRRDFQAANDPCACGVANAAAGASSKGSTGPMNPCTTGGTGGGHGGVCPIAQDQYDSMPCQDPDDICYCSGPKPVTKPKMECRNTDQYCLHVPKGRTRQFEEIGCTVTGNELKIKVPASASIIKKISQTHCEMQRPYTTKKDTGPCDPPCGKNQISLALPSEDVCCGGVHPATTQFTCTTEGCTQMTKHNQQGRGDEERDLPNVDTFVLRVAKTAMENDRKCTLELELVTPKNSDKDPPIEKVNTHIQSDLDCECPVRRLKKTKKKCHCCPAGNKVIFKVPTDSCQQGHRQRAHFNFTSDGIGDLARDEPGQLQPVTAPDYPGVVYDFSSQVIKLRIGKTVELPNRRSKLEYQFITPLMNLKKDIPVSENRTAQCIGCCTNCTYH